MCFKLGQVWQSGGKVARDSLGRVPMWPINRSVMNNMWKKIVRSTCPVALLATTALMSSAAGHTAPTSSTAKRVTRIEFTLDTRYDTNLAQGGLDQAKARGLRRSDIRVTPGVALTVVRPFGRNTLQATAFAGYDIYARNSSLNSERLGLNGEVGLNFGPCLVNLRPSIVRQQSRFSEIYYINTPGIDSIRNRETVQVYGGDVRCGRAYGLRPLVGYEHSIGDNSNSLRRYSDYRGDRYYAGVGYNNPSLGNYSLTYEHNRLVYPHRDSLLPASRLLDRYSGETIRLEGERALGAVIKIKGSVAYYMIDPQTAAVPKFRGVGWQLSGTVSPVSRVSVNLVAEHRPEPSLGAEALYSIDSRYRVQATYAVTPRTSVFAGAEYNRRDYRGATGIYGLLLTEDRIARFNAGAALALTPRIKLTAEAGHERRNANGGIYDYSNSYVGLGARYGF